MPRETEKTRQELINDLIKLGEPLSRVFISPDLDEWRALNVPVAQLKSLFLIVNRPGTNSRLLAKELGVTPGNVTGIVDRLTEQSLVIRKPDAEDRRISWLEATPKGRQLLEKLVESHTRKAMVVLNYMEVDELRALLQGIKGVVAAVEKHMAVLKNEKQSV